ncbi:MAG TPA: zinc ribbon domain-containing protein [Myxococcota bacterium]|nr:zinc ribbon domain-containing protein [Myxococcota bacterium]
MNVHLSRLSVIYTVALAGMLLLVPQARARDDISGTFTEEYTETIYSLDQWGTHCGQVPRSIGRHKRKLTFKVQDRGVDLLFVPTSGKSFSSVACQSDNKAVKPKERTLKDKLFLISCATPETSESYESGLYSFRIQSQDRIEYRETTRFSHNVAGALCVYSRRIRRMYKRIKDAAKVAEIEQPVSAEKVSAQKDDPCETPGPAVRLALTPEKAVLKTGEKFCPKIEATDEHGCPVTAGLSWGKGKQPAGVKLTTTGCLKIDRHALAGSYPIALSAGRAQASVTIEIQRQAAAHAAVPRPPEADGGADETHVVDGGSEAAEAIGAPDAGPKADDSGPVDSGPAAIQVQKPSEAELPAWLLPAAIGGGALIVFVLLAVILGKKRRTRAKEAYRGEPTVPEPLAPVPSRKEQTAQTSADKPDKIFCTTCGKAIPAEAKFCPYDRAPIYSPSSPTLASAPVCPSCKRLLPMGAKFCPYDKTKLK